RSLRSRERTGRPADRFSSLFRNAGRRAGTSYRVSIRRAPIRRRGRSSMGATRAALRVALLRAEIERRVIEAIHAGLNTGFEPHRQHPSGLAYETIDRLSLGRGDRLEDVVRRFGPFARPADADLEAPEAVVPEALDDRGHAAVSSGRALFSESPLAEGQIEVVVDDDELVGEIPLARRTEIAEEVSNGLAAQVHVGLRLHEHDRAEPSGRRKPRLLDLGAKLPARGAEGEAALARERVAAPKARVVPRSRGAAAGVSRTDDPRSSRLGVKGPLGTMRAGGRTL